jgi:predicted GH43/DUF377 family glycosyl hydrolase
VFFAEGMVEFQGKWYLYYGMADSKIGVAVTDRRQRESMRWGEAG